MGNMNIGFSGIGTIQIYSQKGEKQMNCSFIGKKIALLMAIFTCLGISSYAAADASFNSIGGYSIGQPCTGSEFSTSDSQVRNPNDVLDKIGVKRRQIEKKMKGGYDLRVECGIIDNKVNFISLTSNNSDDISVIKDSLKEKMGRPADDSEENNSEPMNLLGNRMDGHKISLEEWFLTDSRTATAYTIITVPYGASSLSELKWRGGIELRVNDRGISEWNHLKQKGSLSSKQQEALTEEKKKERVRGLLD